MEQMYTAEQISEIEEQDVLIKALWQNLCGGTKPEVKNALRDRVEYFFGIRLP